MTRGNIITLLIAIISLVQACPTCKDWAGGEYVLCAFDGLTYYTKCDLFVSLCQAGLVNTGDDVDINTINLEQQVAGFIASDGECEDNPSGGGCPTCDGVIVETKICTGTDGGTVEYSNYCTFAKQLCDEGYIGFDENTEFESMTEEDYASRVTDHVKWEGPCQGKCPSGQYSNTGEYPCSPCSPGSYTDKLGMTSCTLCPVSSYQDTEGQERCKDCPTGHTTSAIGSVSPQDCKATDKCDAGWYSDSGYEPCILCPLDTYTDQEGATQCTPCPGGKQTSNTGADNADQCVTENIAPRGTARQSGVTWGGHPSKAIDSDLHQSCEAVRCSHTHFQVHPWWSLQFDQERSVAAVLVHVPLDTVTGLEGARVTIGNNDNTSDSLCGEITFSKMIRGIQFIECSPALAGTYVRIEGVMEERTYLSLTEVQVFTSVPNITCPRGTFSTTGYYPCQRCPVGYTTTLHDSKNCVECGDGKTTTLTDPGNCFGYNMEACKHDNGNPPCEVYKKSQPTLKYMNNHISSAVPLTGNWVLYSEQDYRGGNLFVYEGEKHLDLRNIYWNDVIESVKPTGTDYDCYTGDGSDYTGHESTTRSGRPCQEWFYDWPHVPNPQYRSLPNSYCRNPDNSPDGPWCYVREIGVEREPCAVPRCQ